MSTEKKKYDLSLGLSETTSLPRKAKEKKADSTVYYLGFFGHLGTGIAVPIALGGFIGSYVDRSMGTHPKAVMTGIAIGFILSIVYFVRMIADFIKYNSKH